MGNEVVRGDVKFICDSETGEPIAAVGEDGQKRFPLGGSTTPAAVVSALGAASAAERAAAARALLSGRPLRIIDVTATMSDAQRASYEAADLSVDMTAHIQSVAVAMADGDELLFPAPGAAKVAGYVQFTSKTNISIRMEGSICPVGSLGNVNSAILRMNSCSGVSIRPKIINPAYAATLNCIRLDACTDVLVHDGRIDVAGIGYDGCAAVQIGAGTTKVTVTGNYIRSPGYGVLGNDGAGVSDITIVDNEIEGQKAYGYASQGDAVEANFPTNPSSRWWVEGNRIHGYQGYHPGQFDARIIAIGMARVQGFSVSHNKIWDIPAIEAIHLEDGTSSGMVVDNTIECDTVGIHLQPNNAGHTLDTIVIASNRVTMAAMPAEVLALGVDYAAAILCNVDSNGDAIAKNVSIVGNTCIGTTGAGRGICVYDVDGFAVAGNTSRGFPRAGFDVRKFGALGTGPSNGSVGQNNSIGNGWGFAIGGLGSSGPLTNVRFDETNFASGSAFANYNSEISTRTGSVIRLPYSVTGNKYSAGDLLVTSGSQGQARELYCFQGGAAGSWAASDGSFEFAKRTISGAASIAVTFASSASANVPCVIEVDAISVKADATELSYATKRFILQHSTALATPTEIAAFAATSGTNPPALSASVSGLVLTLSATFTNAHNSTLRASVLQGNLNNSNQGGIVSAA